MDVADLQTGTAQVKDEIGDRCQKLFQDFLEEFRAEDSDELKYLEDARNLVKPERNTLSVSFADIQEFNQQLATCITEDYYRVYPFLCRAVRNFVKDQADINVPHKEYYLSLTEVPTRIKVRELSTVKVGTLIRISGQVVRTHPVHPELTSGTFTCLDCGTLAKDVEQQFKYTQPSICPNQACQNRSRFILETNRSRFVDFQKIRIQETQAELPRGSIPRSLEVIVRAEAVELAQAGDRCDFIGTLIVVPDVGALNLAGARAESGGRNRVEGGDDNEGVQGLKALGVRELHYRLAFLACTVFPTNSKFGKGRNEWEVDEITAESLKKQMNEQEWTRLFEMTHDKHLYSNLTSSLFPTVHGNEEVKKGILLMLLGGVPKTTMEGTSLRGDINVCIVGDPSTAKSQLLKQVSDFTPRAVYTSGKASSAAGLTAAVVRDEETFEFVIEAGALMLADNGVCCIDEFDKMDPRDQVAIHEAMEQQTISITKAGIKATLNARTSILAAANPAGGQYKREKSLKDNINMGAPIMSRFDLFFILIDEVNEVSDYAIARKICDLHALLEESIDRVYTEDEIRRYIMFARQFKPQISQEAAALLIRYYKSLRQRDSGGTGRNSWRITARQLESMIRLSEAMARLYCNEKVEKSHVEEAFRLLSKSIIRVEHKEIEFEKDDLPDMEDENEERDELNVSGEVEMMEDGSYEHEVSDDSRIPPQSPTSDAGRVPGQARARSQAGSSYVGSQSSEGGAEPKKKKVRMSYDDYRSMANLILMFMRREENRMEEDGGDAGGLRRSDVMNWYLSEIEDDIETEAELLEKKELVEKVIRRLIVTDRAIIRLKAGPLGHQEEEEDPLLIVHPNYTIDLGLQ